MLAVYPPHSTHTLQPLDVVCFKPLAQNYSNQLTNHLHKSQGLVPAKKGDFFRLFWAAWVKTFTKKLIHSAFKSTGLSPWGPNVILSKFAPNSPEPPPVTPPPRPYEGPDWRLADSALQRAVKDKYAEDSVRVRDTLHHLHIQNQLLIMTNKGLEQALTQQKKGDKRAEPCASSKGKIGMERLSGGLLHASTKLSNFWMKPTRQRGKKRLEKQTQLSFVKLLVSSSKSLTLRRQGSERRRR